MKEMWGQTWNHYLTLPPECYKFSDKKMFLTFLWSTFQQLCCSGELAMFATMKKEILSLSHRSVFVKSEWVKGRQENLGTLKMCKIQTLIIQGHFLWHDWNFNSNSTKPCFHVYCKEDCRLQVMKTTDVVKVSLGSLDFISNVFNILKINLKVHP